MTPLLSQKEARFPFYLAAALFLFAGLGYGVVWQTAGESTVYAPEQPVPFSHATHAGRLGIDCLACHHAATKSSRAGFPDLTSCLACHRHVLADDARLAPLHAAANPDAPHFTGEPFAWLRVNALPGFAHFDHTAHVNRGVSCVACHGDMRKADRTASSPKLTMASCLDCHRRPRGIVPLEAISSPEQTGPEADALSERLIRQWHLAPGTDCSTCHH